MDEPQHTAQVSAQSVAETAAGTLYGRDHASRALGMHVLEVHPGYARVAMLVRQDMANGHELCHGGMIFMLADSAFAFACNSYDAVTVAAGATVEFLLPARVGDELTAVAQQRSRSRRSGIYDVEVCNQRGECIALFRGRSREIGGSVSAVVGPPTDAG